ncbi:hypothetical protein PHET_09420 [Paragonimus heterotremus]|uniref:Uncharacterized protein n=1 Tax=Paragonimus heterotremus TaxID=100268 RepID=A0A8J4TBC9_9TREM|nr:hypothetical protein PHET_09420 [Paragonimus heterotremus]
MANQILSRFRAELGSRLVSISEKPTTIMTIQDKKAFKFSITFATHIWEGSIDYPERWLVGLLGVPIMLKPSRTCSRNFRITVYSDQQFQLQMMVSNLHGSIPSEQCACNQFTELLASSLSAHHLPKRVSFSCALNKATVIDANQALVSMRIQIKLGNLFVLGMSDLALKEFFAQHGGNTEVVVSQFPLIPSYGFVHDFQNRGYFVVIIETFAKTSRYTTTALKEKTYMEIPDNPIAISTFCTRIMRRLDIAINLIQCTHLKFMDIHTRPYVQAIVELHKSTRYWDQTHTWSIPLRIAQALNDGTNLNLFNVRLRRQAKYTG